MSCSPARWLAGVDSYPTFPLHLISSNHLISHPVGQPHLRTFNCTSRGLSGEAAVKKVTERCEGYERDVKELTACSRKYQTKLTLNGIGLHGSSSTCPCVGWVIKFLDRWDGSSTFLTGVLGHQSPGQVMRTLATTRVCKKWLVAIHTSKGCWWMQWDDPSHLSRNWMDITWPCGGWHILTIQVMDALGLTQLPNPQNLRWASCWKSKNWSKCGTPFVFIKVMDTNNTTDKWGCVQGQI